MKIHYLHHYFHNPPHPITVALIGCGGTGSNLLTQLGRIDYCLKELEHPGLFVTVFDADRVTEANLGRQLFSRTEIDQYKSIANVTRCNRFFGTNWKAIPDHYSMQTSQNLVGHNIIVSCVDTAGARLEIDQVIKTQNCDMPCSQPGQIHYWLDTGNTKKRGQVVIGSIRKIKQPAKSKYKCIAKLPTLLDLFPNIEEHDQEEIQGPSCSVPQALARQDLFINSLIAQYAGDLLWNTLKEGFTLYNGEFINLESKKANPIRL